MPDKSYFQMFPTVEYDADGLGNSKVVVDIMKRIRVMAENLSDKTLFYRYAMKDQETIEDVAYRVYGSTKYHWILLLLNNIEDAFYDVPLDTIEFESYIDSKYGSVDQSFSKSISIYNGETQKNGNIVSSDVASTTYETLESTLTGKVNIGDSVSLIVPYGWYSETVVTPSSTPPSIASLRKVSYTAPQTVTSIDNTGGADGLGLKKFTTDLASNTFVQFNANTDITVKESVNVLTNIEYFQRDLKDSEGNIIYKDLITDLEDYGNPDTITTAVSRYDYEETTNESHRNILILRRDLLSDFVQEFQGLMKG